MVIVNTYFSLKFRDQIIHVLIPSGLYTYQQIKIPRNKLILKCVLANELMSGSYSEEFKTK